jgi:hypothetical protein
MSIALVEQPSTPAQVAKLAGDLMAESVNSAEPISQGANSRVYRLRSSSGEYVMKFYFQHPQDTRDRLATEFKSLSFLWEHSIRQIPQPLKAWAKQSCALYAMVKGSSPARELTEGNVDGAVDFLKTLKGLSQLADAKGFAPASEAFFSAKGIIDNLKSRLKRLSIEDKSKEYQALREYLQDDLAPLLENVAGWSNEYLISHGGSGTQEIMEKFRTLSSSDFGFHNALCTSQGVMVFLDFEYFGWDDPVKTVSDFLWHPAMSLTENLKRRFVDGMTGVFSDDPQFQIRLKALYPLFGLKWCLIFLNEFIPMDMQRRGFAQGITSDKTALRLGQLVKAKTLTQKIRDSYKEFPYGN